MATSARGSGGGFELLLELTSDDLLPGRRVDGLLSTFHVVIAVAWARDPHLVRDIAICSTTEI